MCSFKGVMKGSTGRERINTNENSNTKREKEKKQNNLPHPKRGR